MTTADKLNYLAGTKNAIKQAIAAKGITVSDTDSFRSYADKIEQINGGAESLIPNDTTSFAYMCSYDNAITTSSTALQTISDFSYTHNISSMESMFCISQKLTTIPMLKTDYVTNMSTMFSGCSSLTEIPPMDTKNVTNMSSMFNGCRALTSVPQLDTHNVTDMRSMFNGCRALTSVPQLDTHNVTDMNYMFSSCNQLVSVSFTDTSKVTDMGDIFSRCQNLTTVFNIDTSSLDNNWSCDGMFDRCASLANLTFNPNQTGFRTRLDIDLSTTSILTDAEATVTFNSLPDITKMVDNAYPSQRLRMPGINNTISAEVKKIATDKGWTIIQ